MVFDNTLTVARINALQAKIDEHRATIDELRNAKRYLGLTALALTSSDPPVLEKQTDERTGEMFTDADRDALNETWMGKSATLLGL